MSESTHEFTLTDRNGNDHRYVTTVILPSKGGDQLVRELSALLSEPLAPVIVPMFTGDGSKGLDAGEVGRGVKQALRDLDMRLVRKILSETFRDGVRLNTDEAYDAAYSRNYGEMIGALKEVIQYNGFLDFLSFNG